MNTRLEIINSALGAYEKAKLIEKLPPEPPPPVPVMTREIRARLVAVAGQIRAQQTGLTALVAKEFKLRQQHEALSAELPMLVSGGDPDDPSSVQRAVQERMRHEMMTNFLKSFPERRMDLLRELSSTLGQVDKIFEGLARPGDLPTQFYAIQGSPDANCFQALAFIELKLREQ